MGRLPRPCEALLLLLGLAQHSGGESSANAVSLPFDAIDANSDGVISRLEFEQYFNEEYFNEELAARLPRRAQAECEAPEQLLPITMSMPVIVLLVSFSGLFSGLTLGLMGLDLNGLEIVAKGGDEKLAKCAKKIIPVRAKGNQLLCTLLLGNVAVNSALAILTAEIASGALGFVVSTALIVIFGEILPQAACSRYALQVGARTVCIVKVLICLFYILTKPMSLMLDYMLGQEVGTTYSPTMLTEMLKQQVKLGAFDTETGQIAQQVAEGAMSFRDKEVHEVMTPLIDAYMLPAETRLGYDMIREIFETGYSRIPVYGRDKNDYRGLLVAKDLMLADPEDEMKLGDFIMIFNRKVESFFKTDHLVKVLNCFKKGGTHMGLVREAHIEDAIDPRFEICGVLTLEDVMEEILQEEIVDETDAALDGGKNPTYNLAVFNPHWKSMLERLSSEEVAAIAAHLSRVAFCPDTDLGLSLRAIEWLVSISEVRNIRGTKRGERLAILPVLEPREPDWIYHFGRETDKCTLVLQGRLGLRVGHEAFRSEAGAFSVMAKGALHGPSYAPDFGAFVLTDVRLLVITRARFEEARRLDKNKGELEGRIICLEQEALGQVTVKDAMHKKKCLLDEENLAGMSTEMKIQAL
mmetsp:Transcript_58440/g.126439  ORF Transcript_58440/g.126439 Transcript_58440/m.126439 type:complete len:638 (+) Transcript_58440:61-1974(+)